MWDMKRCLCGATPIMYEDWDMLQIRCLRCGRKGKLFRCLGCERKGKLFFGDCYDESFMKTVYGRLAVKNWNQEIECYRKNLWFYGVGGGDAE